MATKGWPLIIGGSVGGRARMAEMEPMTTRGRQDRKDRAIMSLDKRRKDNK